MGKNDNMILILTSACHSKTQQSPLSVGYVNGRPVTLLRDTGCKNLAVKKSLVLKDRFTGEHVTCLLADSTKMVVLVAKIDIYSSYLTGINIGSIKDNAMFSSI